MKILQVVHQYFPNYWTGTENYTRMLGEYLAKKNNQILIFTVEPNQKNFKIKKSKDQNKNIEIIKIFKKSLKFSFKKTFLSNQMEQVFEKTLKDFKPDLVLIQHLMNHSLNYYKILKKQKIPYLFLVHDYWFMCPHIRAFKILKNKNYFNCDLKRKKCDYCLPYFINKIPVVNLIAKILFWNKRNFQKREAKIKAFIENAEKLIVFSQFVENRLKEFGVKKNKIIKISHGV
jgi:glycosyltransferase involved in cell wall biosynthesis